jgi:hypothetical protein
MWPYPVFALYNMDGRRITCVCVEMQSFDTVIRVAKDEKKYNEVNMFRVAYEKDEGEAEHYCYLTL